VHAEVEDTNTMEGPGIARSEVVFLEVPFPDSDDSGEGAGGGGGGSAEPINPLQLQMEILKSTMALGSDAHSKEIKSLAHDQRQNAGYTGQIERMANGPGLEWLASALKHARQSMEKAAQWLDRPSPANAIPEEEAALGFLVDAAKLLDDAIKEGLIPPKCEADGMTFTLRPPRNNSSESDPEESESEDAGEKVRQLVEEVKRQLEKQETLNRGEGDAQQRAQQQSALSQDAQTAAKEARSLPSVENSKGNPKAAAEALERAARYQEENTDALTEGDHATSTELGEKSAEALDQALQQLSAQFDLHDFASDAHPEGFEKLVNDYLRSISYE
jgi:hypothetical protein